MSEAEQVGLGGSCLCGGVKYKTEGDPRVTVACHCSMCRKLTGSAFGAWALVPLDAFRFVSGEDLVERFVSSEHGQRLFCRRCGSTLGSLTARRPTFMHLAAGTIDGAPKMKLGMHAYAASSAPWFEITDELPRYADEPVPSRKS